MSAFFKNSQNLDKKIQALTIVKSTTWIMLGISSMFVVDDLTSKPSDDNWLFPLLRFGLAVAFLLAGIFFQKNSKRNVYLLLVVVLIDIVVCTQAPIGLFDFVMLLFDLVLYWLIFVFLKQERI